MACATLGAWFINANMPVFWDGDALLYNNPVVPSTKVVYDPTAVYAGKQAVIAIRHNGACSLTRDTSYVTVANVWTAAQDNKWENRFNWSCKSVPNATTNVIINAGPLYAPVISSNVTCYTLTVSPQAALTVMPGFNVTVLH